LLEVSDTVAEAGDWQQTRHGLLWLYHLHYFNDLVARGFPERRAWHLTLIERWLDHNPPGPTAAWDPYPTSLRIVNWIKWILAADPVPAALAGRMADSLAMQARWLSGRFEIHLMGNHLWTNAGALAVAGLFFEGPEADRWRAQGLSVLSGQWDEQVLGDGGHFERSPMYHALLLEDVLDLIQMSRVFPGVLTSAIISRLQQLAVRMLRWLQVMSHPDGDVAFFNDAAFGEAAPYAVLAHYADGLGVEADRQELRPLERLPDSGYVRLSLGRAVVLCDVAPVGPDYQPGHAHADTLSFELSLDGRRVLVNGGTSTYAPGAERHRQRGTAAHNTVEVDRANSSDVWAAFRVGRRARPFDVTCGQSPEGVWAEAAHDGYRHRGHVIHRRRWGLDANGLTMTDTLDGEPRPAVARFMLHPSVAGAATPVITVRCDPPLDVTRRAATWHPRFGQSIATDVLEVAVAWPRTVTRVEWA